MLLYEMFNDLPPKPTLIDALRNFLPMAIDYLQLKELPKIHFVSDIDGHETFGGYNPKTKEIKLHVINRHPVDVLRTLAHEMVHCAQNCANQLRHDSGKTGSAEENQANAIAGVIMREFNSKYPQYLHMDPITPNSTLAERKRKKTKRVRSIPYYGGYYGYYWGDGSSSDGGDSGGGESMAESLTPQHIHDLADSKGVKWDDEPDFLRKTQQLTGKAHLDDLNLAELAKVKQWLDSLKENYKDGKKPGRKGLAKRMGVDCSKSVTALRKIAKNSSGERQRMAHWCANMKAGKK